MKFGIKAEEHLRVMEEAALPHGFSHRLKQVLIHLDFVHLKLHMS